MEFEGSDIMKIFHFRITGVVALTESIQNLNEKIKSRNLYEEDYIIKLPNNKKSNFQEILDSLPGAYKTEWFSQFWLEISNNL